MALRFDQLHRWNLCFDNLHVDRSPPCPHSCAGLTPGLAQREDLLNLQRTRYAVVPARPDPLDRGRGTFAGEQVDQEYLAPVPLNCARSDHLILAVIGALDQDIRPDRFNQRKRGVFGEKNHQIDRSQRRENGRPGRFLLYRPLRLLEALDRGVGVEPDDEPVARGSRLGQQMNVTRISRKPLASPTSPRESQFPDPGQL